MRKSSASRNVISDRADMPDIVALVIDMSRTSKEPPVEVPLPSSGGSQLQSRFKARQSAQCREPERGQTPPMSVLRQCMQLSFWFTKLPADI
jgi:hypothetical protein